MVFEQGFTRGFTPSCSTLVQVGSTVRWAWVEALEFQADGVDGFRNADFTAEFGSWFLQVAKGLSFARCAFAVFLILAADKVVNCCCAGLSLSTEGATF